MRALAASCDVGVFGLYATPSDAHRDANGTAVRISERFTQEVMPQLKPRSLRWLREPNGHPTDGWYADAVMAELAGFLDDRAARLVVIEGMWLHAYIAPLRELGCHVVLDSHGVEAELHDELAARISHRVAAELAKRTPRLEAAAYRAADQVWIPSEREAAIVRQRYGDDLPLVVVPNAIDLDRYPESSGERDGCDVVFPAAFGFLPNTLAARRLLNDIFPALRARVPEARLSLVGRDPSEDMVRAANGSDRIQVTGQVPDTIPYFRRASVMAVPLGEGHGTRFKILEAFASRVPVVSTRKGIEGIDARPGTEFLLAETDAEFVDALTLLMNNSGLRDQLAGNAFELVRSRYSLPRISEVVTGALTAELFS